MLKLVLPGFDVLLQCLEPAWLRSFTPHIYKCVSRSDGDLTTVAGVEAALFNHFGMCAEAGRDLPIAAVSCLSLKGGDISLGDWMCIDPVFLQADVADSLLHSASGLDISMEEAQALLDTLRWQFPEYEFFCATPDHWYLRAAEKICLQTYPVSVVSNSYINRALPQGASSRHWLLFLTEVQMLFFEHVVNVRRETEGRMPVNSVWLYGAGALPEGLTAAFSQVYSNDLLTQGLACLSHVQCARLPVSVDDVVVNMNKSIMLVDCSSLDSALSGQADVLRKRVLDYELNYFGPIVRCLSNGTLDMLELDFCKGCCYRVSRWALRRFWRSKLPFMH